MSHARGIHEAVLGEGGHIEYKQPCFVSPNRSVTPSGNAPLTSLLPNEDERFYGSRSILCDKKA